MIETNTTWQDSGFDCDHCGGELLLRTDRESGQADKVCYQCRECGCQWSLSGDANRIGTGSQCKTSMGKSREGDVWSGWLAQLSQHLWVVIALVAGVFLLRFGGAVVLRLLLPLVIVGVAGYVLLRYGRTQEWW